MALKETTWSEISKLISPFPYALGVTLDKTGKPNIIGLSWWNMVSGKPLMCMISVAPPRYSYECLENHPEFTLCFPSAEQSKGAWFCGRKSGRDYDKFAETSFSIVDSTLVKVPLIDGCTAAFECKVMNKMDAGDHRIYVGEILALHADAEQPGHIFTIGYSEMIRFGADLIVEGYLDKYNDMP